MLQTERSVLIRPWPKEIRQPVEEGKDPEWKVFYFMGLRKKPGPVYNTAARQAASVDLNGPVAEFRQQVVY